MIQAFNWVAFFTASVASLCGKVDFNQEVRPILANNCFKCHGPDAKARYAEAATLKRQGTPRELADAVLYLVSQRATYVNGATLHVNGGSLLV